MGVHYNVLAFPAIMNLNQQSGVGSILMKVANYKMSDIMILVKFWKFPYRLILKVYYRFILNEISV